MPECLELILALRGEGENADIKPGINTGKLSCRGEGGNAGGGGLYLPETFSRDGCTFPRPYSGKAVPYRNPLPGRLYLPYTLFREGCTFPKPYSGKAVPSRNPIPGRLYLAETLYREGCTFPKLYFRKVVPSRNPILGRLFHPETLIWTKPPPMPPS